MSIDQSQIEVKHNTEQHRFEVVIDGKEAFTLYMLGEKLMTFVHTEVPEEFEGQGIGGKIAHTALEYAKEHGYRVQAICPFISAYIKRHPEYQPITMGY